MLFTAGLLPGGSPREITNGLDDGTLDGVILTGGLAGKGSVGRDVEEFGRSALWLRRRLGVGRHCCKMKMGDGKYVFFESAFKYLWPLCCGRGGG